jgi:hypothetical protein
MESIWVHSALRPLIGLLCQPRVIMMMEKLVEWLAGETEELGENMPQCRFVHHKPQITWPGANLGRRGGKPATKFFFYYGGLWGYWHCGHSWPIVPASGDSVNDRGEADGI